MNNKNNKGKMNNNITIYEKNVSEPWFSLIKLGLKTVEGRLIKGDFAKMKKNDIIIWKNNDFDFERTFQTKIIKIKKYKSFEQYLTKEGLDKCLPGIDNLENGVQIYHKYYSKNQENTYGINAIHLQII